MKKLRSEKLRADFSFPSRGVGPVEVKRKKGGRGGRVGAGVGTAKGTCKLLL